MSEINTNEYGNLVDVATHDIADHCMRGDQVYPYGFGALAGTLDVLEIVHKTSCTVDDCQQCDMLDQMTAIVAATRRVHHVKGGK